jgi:predicted Ser/Thr protein kinase
MTGCHVDRFLFQADVSDLRGLAADLAERTTRSELHQSINNHVKPLVSALNSLEGALSTQEVTSRQQHQNFHDKAAALERMYHEQQEYRLTHALNASGSAPCSVDRVHTIVEDIIRDRRLGEVRTSRTYCYHSP